MSTPKRGARPGNRNASRFGVKTVPWGLRVPQPIKDAGERLAAERNQTPSQMFAAWITERTRPQVPIAQVADAVTARIVG